MARYWVDPPQGYLFGFPKIYDNDNDPPLNEWLVSHGYPVADVEEDWFYVRQWTAEDDK